MDTNTETTEAPQWAVIELMGHNRTGGQVSKDTQFGTPLLRVDVPQGDGFITQLVNPSSIYRITMTSEEIARCAAKQGDAKPMHSWELDAPKIAAPADEAEDDIDDIPNGDFF